MKKNPKRKVKGKKKRVEDVVRIKKVHLLIFVIAFVSFAGGVLFNYWIAQGPVETEIITTPTTSTTIKEVQKKDVVEVGDEVEINYIVKLEDGRVYDTSYEDLAKEVGLNKTEYKPLIFTVGSMQVIEGLDEAVKGMRKGEEKTVIIPPEKGFGFRDEARVQEFPRIQENPRIHNISIEEFERLMGRDVEPILNKTYESQFIQWPIRVLNFSETNVVIRDEPEVNMTLKTMYEEAKVISVNETEIRVKITSSPGAKLNTMVGQVTVLEVNETTIKIDTNPELAGKNLIFTIKIEDITKG